MRVFARPELHRAPPAGLSAFCEGCTVTYIRRSALDSAVPTSYGALKQCVVACVGRACYSVAHLASRLAYDHAMARVLLFGRPQCTFDCTFDSGRCNRAEAPAVSTRRSGIDGHGALVVASNLTSAYGPRTARTRDEACMCLVAGRCTSVRFRQRALELRQDAAGNACRHR